VVCKTINRLLTKYIIDITFGNNDDKVNSEGKLERADD